MKRSLSLFSLLLMTSLLVILPVSAQEVNLTDECVAEYDPEVDYFPEKVEVNEAENFAVEYFNNYKIVTVTDAFAGADPFTYVLVQCGTPAPETAELPDNTQFIEVPTGDFIAMSTTQVPHLIDLDLLDNLVGLDSTLFVNSPEVVELIEADELIEVGSGSDVNVELVLETEPDIVMTFGFDPASDAHPILIERRENTRFNQYRMRVTGRVKT
ncbi:MAG: ABC transporter substrate-binding protein, partial [Chloroflexota bacterium]